MATTENNARLYKFLDYLSWGFLLVAILCMRLAGGVIQNTLDRSRFIWTFVILGVMLSAALIRVLYLRYPEYYKNGNENRGSAVLSMFFAIPVFVLYLSTFINYKTAEENARKIKTPVLSKQESIYPRKHFLMLPIRDQKLKTEVKAYQWKDIKMGDTVAVRLGKGKLDFWQVLGVNAPRD